METYTFMNPETAEYLENLEAKVHRLERSNLIRRFIIRCGIILVLVAVFYFSIVHLSNNVEMYSTTARYHLMNGVEAGNAEDISRFNKYIEKDVYLFNGPTTINAMANKYDLDADELTKEFKESGYDELQKFFDKVIKDRVNA